MKLNIYTSEWAFGTFGERYVPNGYFDEMAIDKQFEIMSKIEGLKGFGVTYPTDQLTNNPDKLVKKLANYNLRVGDMLVENFADRKWKHGALGTNEEKIRKENIKLCKEAMDFAAEIPGTSVMVWPAHDGFDYPFQVNYEDGWKRIVESYREICEHNPKVRIIVEYKQKDPRQKMYISNVGKMMMLFNDVGMDNLTGALDIGHALMSQENLAESLAILDMHGKLNSIHLNDNYRDADSDLMFGTISFWENLEMFYHLNKTNFGGWIEVDVVSPRDDRIKTLKLTVKMIFKYKELADKLSKHSEEIDKNLKGYHFADNMDLIIDILF